MINEVIFSIKQNKKLYEYLKYHSYWYQIIINDETSVKEMIKEMKKEYKETIEDKMIDFSKKIEMFSRLLDVLT